MKYEIGKFNGPVAAIAVDVSGNGRTDVVICHEYGATMLDCDPDGGWVTWLENPGRDRLSDGPWKRRNIGRWPAMHRLRAGHFTQRSVCTHQFDIHQLRALKELSRDHRGSSCPRPA